MKERYTLRQSKLSDLSFTQIAKLLALEYRDDPSVLAPYALSRFKDVDTDVGLDEIYLLEALLGINVEIWSKLDPECVEKIRDLCSETISFLDDELSAAESADSKMEYLEASNSIFAMENRIVLKMYTFELELNLFPKI